MKALELADAYADACRKQALQLRHAGLVAEQKRDELAAELRRLAAVEAEFGALKAELEGRYQSIIEMGNMLTEIVNMIRGEPEEGTSHSTHDAVELVRSLAMHNDQYAIASANEVAKLKAENERLLAANLDCIAHYEDARAEHDALLELLREALEALTCGDTGDDLEDSHRCGRCDEYVDRNAKLRMKIRAALARPS